MACSQNAVDADAGDPEDGLQELDTTAHRILNLLFVLSTTSTPLTTERIVSDSDLGYGSSNRTSDLRKFKRDRERLAAHGIVVREVRAAGAAKTEESFWEIDRGRTHAEQGTLSTDDAAIVLAAIDETFELHANNPARWPLQRAQLKLRELVGKADEPSDEPENGGDAAADAYSPILQGIWNAFMDRRPARFTYEDAGGAKKEREVEIYGAFARGNRSYFVGFDRGVGGMRTFRTDRIVRARHTPASAGTYRIPAEFDVEDYQFLPFDFSDAEPVGAVFRVPAAIGEHELTLLTQGRGDLARGDTEDDCWTWTVEVRDITAAAAWALSHARLGMRPVEPSSLVACWRRAIERTMGAQHV